jgi:FlaA1/EpsC-like NDP-sugar epimerase
MKLALLKNRRWLAEALDLFVVAFALTASFLLRLDFKLEPQYRRMLAEALPLALATKLILFRLAGLRHLAWRYVGFQDLLRIALANAGASVTAGVVLYSVLGPSFPRSIYGIDFATERITIPRRNVK